MWKEILEWGVAIKAYSGDILTYYKLVIMGFVQVPFFVPWNSQWASKLKLTYKKNRRSYKGCFGPFVYSLASALMG